jgi:hypothetical protein
VRIEGGALQSRDPLEVFAGANALAVLTPAGEWEIVQFLDAQLVAPDTYALRRLLRGQGGSEPAMTLTPAGAPVVVLDRGLPRARVSSSERGLPLLWRAAPLDGTAAFSSETTFTWRGLQARPWAPAHLRARPSAGGAVRVSWVRRARIGGDSWEGEPPLSEEREVYRLDVFRDGALTRTVETSSTSAVYSADQIADDGPLVGASFEVRQGSGVFGWGAPARCTL